MKKRELRKTLRKVKRGKMDSEEYIKRRKEYKIWCKKEKEKHEKKEEERIRLIKTEAETWRYINRYRKKRERVDEISTKD